MLLFLKLGFQILYLISQHNNFFELLVKEEKTAGKGTTIYLLISISLILIAFYLFHS